MGRLLSQWFPWFFSLPEPQQNFLLVVLPLAVTGAVAVIVWLRKGLVSSARVIGRHAAALRAESERLAPRPKLTLLECFEAEENGLTGVNEAVGKMEQASVQFAAYAKANGAKRALKKNLTRAEWNTQRTEDARALTRFSDALAPAIRQFKHSHELVSDAWSSRMYWHDERGSAKHILTDELPERMLKLRSLAHGSAAIFGDQKQLDGLGGWTPILDKAVKRHRALREQIVATSLAFESTCDQVLDFYARRAKSVRGKLLLLRLWSERVRSVLRAKR